MIQPVMCGQYVNPQADVGFLNQNYRYESVATQISHDSGLASIRPAA